MDRQRWCRDSERPADRKICTEKMVGWKDREMNRKTLKKKARDRQKID